jgi:tRNA G10  N-methylase Trm11
MFLVVLGRQPEIGIAELERVYGSSVVTMTSQESALLETDSFDLNRLGGVIKAGKVIAEISTTNWLDVSKKVIQYYTDVFRNIDGKITLGISAYNFPVSAREVQKTGIVLKARLKNRDGSIRLIPNTEIALSSATSHHNKLGSGPNKVELLIVKSGSKSYLAESVGTQNITAYAMRDQNRPKRDAFVGMLPPKLAQIIVNLAVGDVSPSPDKIVLDPFCGTGVVLQEALLMGFGTEGSDLSDKMIDYSGKNIDWLRELSKNDLPNVELEQADATTHTWPRAKSFVAVAAETYLGQPFSAPPSPDKLKEVQGNCNHIISTFMRNIGDQIAPGTTLCLAVPAWRGKDGSFTHLPLAKNLEKLGYSAYEFKNISMQPLLYYREDQVVARELLVLRKV